ncbi:MAG TPA: hypothetical protein VIU64_21740 [Polyangia bacterium]
MATGRWHIELVEEDAPPTLVVWQPQPEPPEPEAEPDFPNLLPLLSALRRLEFRAGEPGAWGAPLSRDPIAFLLDSITEAVNVRTTSGELVYSNRSAAELAPLGPPDPGVSEVARDGQRFERRAVAFETIDATYIVEILREIGNG